MSNGEITVAETTNNAGGFSKGDGGAFNNQCANNCGGWTYSTDHFYTFVNGSAEDSWARWQPAGIPSDGAVYEVQAFIPNNATDTTSWQAPYKIVHANGTASAVIDQVGSINKWISLGTYRMNSGNYVYLTDASGETSRRLSADSVKFIRRETVHTPDIRYNNNSWSSTLYVRTNGGYTRARANFRNAAGSNLCTADITLNANAQVPLPLATYCAQTTVQSVIIDSSQDLSVAVVQERSSTYATDAYSGVSSPPTSVRVPIFQKNNSTWNSDLYIYNAGTANMKVDLQFSAWTGTSATCNDFMGVTVAPGGSFKVSAADLAANGCNVGSTFVGSVLVSNTENQPLAIASTQYPSSQTQLMETSNSQPLANKVYAPLLQNNNGNPVWQSGLALTRSSSSSSFDLRYYKADTGGECANQTNQTSNPLVVFPAPLSNPTGCGLVPNGVFKVNDGSITMAANVNQLVSGANNATTYAAISQPQKTAIIPKLITNNGWSDAFVIQNTATLGANVTIKYYNASGSLNSIATTIVYTKYSAVIVPPANFNGSATVIADQPIAVSVNSYKNGNSGTLDIIGSYPATHR